MRKTIIGLVSLLLISASGFSYAQTTKEQRKERQELAKASKKELNEKASKAARKEAKLPPDHSLSKNNLTNHT